MWPNSTGANQSFFYKTLPEDFCVAELPLQWADARPVHWYGYIEKRNRTTQSVAAQLAACVGEAESSVGYAGMKDGVGITRQWFSLPLQALRRNAPSALPETIAQDPSLCLLDQQHHGRKLRKGELRGNRFAVRLVMPGSARAITDARLVALRTNGMPNYFGVQRFGTHMANLARARRWLDQRRTQRGRQRQIKPFTKGLYLSVLRAFLFNEVLAQRVGGATWDKVLDGDLCTGPDATAPLWGRGRSQTKRRAAALEAKALAPHQALLEGLEFSGATQMRRALRVTPRNFRWQWLPNRTSGAVDDLMLQFELPPGSYATTLLAELGDAQLGYSSVDSEQRTAAQRR